ncbi:hypothetical protein A8L45_08280 [Veronia pacifica]|uniref:Uncharacterized protein n=1 Tax=Veronia pacifica TaxID=1080227 RepID=A0A1C3ELC1_9GAMM|nr:hypothetical protein A8L45_08280 [Veronia pacifica]
MWLSEVNCKITEVQHQAEHCSAANQHLVMTKERHEDKSTHEIYEERALIDTVDTRIKYRTDRLT